MRLSGSRTYRFKFMLFKMERCVNILEIVHVRVCVHISTYTFLGSTTKRAWRQRCPGTASTPSAQILVSKYLLY